MPNSGGYAMEFDAQSGQTLAPPGPWQQLLSEPPRLPDSNYKVVFRPQTGLRVAAWNERQLTHSLQQASEIPEHLLYARATVQIQASQTLIVAGTPEENCALTLREISTIQLGAATYEVLPYLKPLPEIRRGVIHGLDPGTATDQLSHVLAKNGARILHARMLGNSTSAVVTSEGIHVLFYTKAYGLFTRCRLYRQTVQCWSLCGSSDTGRTSAQIPTRQCELSATQGIPHQTTTAPPSANSVDWPTRRLTRTAAKSCVHHLLHCEYENEPSPHSGVNNNPPRISSLLSNDNSHRTSRTNNSTKFSALKTPPLIGTPDTTPLTSRAPTPVPTNISHFERIIYEMGERLDNHLITLDQRIHANEEAKRHARKRPKQCTLFRTSGDMSPPLQFDDD
ncbi:hypothetical protein HPB47_001554 [Ixodes persulcatus]|uniref:Uncharacterized protein n=1 Tax=Ixodes persulcatus TaxID=34615 RepID=A0AC60QZE3_IXOPE|nr:hypothetical protein HPB47_001554 [Ixodes persulcatus]